MQSLRCKPMILAPKIAKLCNGDLQASSHRVFGGAVPLNRRSKSESRTRVVAGAQPSGPGGRSPQRPKAVAVSSPVLERAAHTPAPPDFPEHGDRSHETDFVVIGSGIGGEVLRRICMRQTQPR